MPSYFVNADTGNDALSGTSELSAWKTLARCVQSPVTSGDTVYLRGTTWYEKLWVFEKPYTSLVTFKKYRNEQPIIDGTRVYLNPADASGLVWASGGWTYRTKNVQFEGLLVRNSTLHAIATMKADNINIVDNFTENSQKSGVMVYRSNYVLVHNTDIQRACKASETGRAGDECLSVACQSSNVEVRYNYVHKAASVPDGASGGEGINVKGGDNAGEATHDVTLHHNICRQDERLDGQTPNRLCYAVDGWQAGVYNVYFYSNIAYNGAYGYVPESEQGGKAENIWMYNNIGYNLHRAGLIIPTWARNEISLKRNIYLINNTLYKCLVGARFDSASVENVQLRNNIFRLCTTPITTAGGVASGQIFQSNNWTTGDPLFVNPGSADFHLLAGSLCRDAGYDDLTIRSRVTSDFDGIRRPQGLKYDIGAYEYVSGVTLPIDPIVLTVG